MGRGDDLLLDLRQPCRPSQGTAFQECCSESPGLPAFRLPQLFGSRSRRGVNGRAVVLRTSFVALAFHLRTDQLLVAPEAQVAKKGAVARMNPRGIYVYVTPFFPSPKNWRGGFSLDAVKALARCGWRVEVFVGRSKKNESGDYVYDGVTVHQFVRQTTPCELAPFLVERRNVHSFLRSFDEVGLKAADVAVCHVHTVFFAAYAQALKCRNPGLVAALQHHFSPPFHLCAGRLGELPGHATLLYRHWRRRCGEMDVQVFTSERSRSLYACDARGVDLRRHLLFGRWMRPFASHEDYVLYNGFDPTVFKPGNTAKPVGVKPVIGCVANFFPGKGQLNLLKAVALLADRGRSVKVRLVGSGKTRDVCERFAREHRLDVEFLDEMPHAALPEFYRSLDLYVLPSTYAEGFNCTCAEAHGSGIPVLGFAGTSLDEAIIRERDRWLAPSGDINRLADLMARALRNRHFQTWDIALDIDHVMADWTRWVESRTNQMEVVLP